MIYFRNYNYGENKKYDYQSFSNVSHVLPFLQLASIGRFEDNLKCISKILLNLKSFKF